MLKKVSARTFSKLTSGVSSRLGRSRKAMSALRLSDLSPTALKRPGALKRLTSGFQGSLHTRGFVLWAAALVTGILCVTQHVYASQLAEEIGALRNAREELEAEIGFLKMDQARLTGRERIEEYATERLGMRYPEAHEVVRLGPGTHYSGGRWDDGLVQGGTGAVNDG